MASNYTSHSRDGIGLFVSRLPVCTPIVDNSAEKWNTSTLHTNVKSDIHNYPMATHVMVKEEATGKANYSFSYDEDAKQNFTEQKLQLLSISSPCLTMPDVLKCPFPEHIEPMDSNTSIKQTTFADHPLVKHGYIGASNHAYMYGKTLPHIPVANMDGSREVQQGDDCGCFYLCCDLLCSSDSDDSNHVLVDYGYGPKSKVITLLGDSSDHSDNAVVISSYEKNEGTKDKHVYMNPKQENLKVECIRSSMKKKAKKTNMYKKISKTSSLSASSTYSINGSVIKRRAYPMKELSVVAPLQLRNSVNDTLRNDLLLEMETIVGPRERWPARIYSIIISRKLSYMNVLLLSLFGYINRIPRDMLCSYEEANGVHVRFIHNIERLYQSFESVPENYNKYYSFSVRNNRNECLSGDERK